jgi:sugar-phosphatase
MGLWWRGTAVLLDCDGVLVDSTRAVISAWEGWCNSFDLPSKEVLPLIHGRRAVDTISTLLPRSKLAEGVAALEQAELSSAGTVTAMPGAAAFVGSLSSSRWAVVTSASRRLACARLRAAGLPVPCVLVGSEDVDTGKPDPTPYAVAAGRLSTLPTQCLVVEDAPSGAAAGIAAGATVVAVTSTHAMGAFAADAVVPDLRSLRADVTAGDLLVSIRSNST